MREALRQAARAGEAGEVPVGAVIVRKAASSRGRSPGGTAQGRHGARRDARAYPGRGSRRRLAADGLHTYVTKEPCPMCRRDGAYPAGARVFGASDRKAARPAER